jgi:hypothetical protein
MLNLRCLVLALIVLVPSFANATEPSEPPLGRYNVRAWGATGKPPLFLGHFVLEAGGKYKVYLPGGRLVGEGTYMYDSATKKVKWLTGKYAEEGWDGRVIVASDEKTMTIWMKSTTRATPVLD